jgi:hypothetical protein
MMYTFVKPFHVALFRMEVQMAAASREKHIRGPTLRFLSMAMDNGQWARFGAISVNCIAEKREGSLTYSKMILYEPHSHVSFWLYDSLIELAFDVETFFIKRAGKAFISPEFEEWIYKDNHIIRTAHQQLVSLKDRVSQYSFTEEKER